MSNDSAVPTQLVSISEAAELLGISIDTVRRWDKQGILHSQRPNGKDRYFSVKEIKDLKATQPLSISEVAEKLGVSATTLRRYEEEGLIKPQRNNNGERLYTREIIASFIKTNRHLLHHLPPESNKKDTPEMVGSLVTAIKELKESEHQTSLIEKIVGEDTPPKTCWYDGISPQCKDFVLFRLFLGIIIAGWGILFLLRNFLGIIPRETDFLYVYAGWGNLAATGLLISGLITIIINLFSKQLDKYHQVIDLFSVVCLGSIAWFASQNGNPGMVIIASSIIITLLVELKRGCMVCYEGASFFKEFIFFTLMLMILKGLSVIIFGDIHPFEFLGPIILIHKELFAVVWFVVCAPFLLFLFTRPNLFVKYDIPFFIAAGVISFTSAILLSISSSWPAAFFCYLYAIFVLFLLWWRRSDEVIDGQKLPVVILSFVWIALAIILSLFSIANLKERLRQTALDDLRESVASFAIKTDALFDNTSPALISSILKENAVAVIQKKDTEQAISLAENIYNSIPNLDRVILMDAKGLPVGVYPRNTTIESGTIHNEYYLPQTQSTLRPYTSNVFKSVTGDTVIAQTEPIFVKNILVGVIVVHIDMTDLNAQLVVEQNGNNLIAVDENGIYALNQDLGKIGTQSYDVIKKDTLREWQEGTVLKVTDYAKTPRLTITLEQDTKTTFEKISYIYVIMAMFIIVNSALSLTAGLILAKRTHE